MKSIKLIILFLSACIFSFSVTVTAADEKKYVANGTNIILQYSGGRNPNKRPNIPSRQIIECNYDAGKLTIDFTIPEGMCKVQLTEINSGRTTYYYIDSSPMTASIFVGTIYESIIEVETEDNNIYIGALTSEYNLI